VITLNVLSNAEAALLGLLSESPMYPYQIEQEVKYRDMRFWTDLSMSSIYKLLGKLEKGALVSSKNQISPENRLRKLYVISDKGKAVLEDTIRTILSTPEHTKWQIDIGTYNCHLLQASEVREALERYRAGLQEKIKGYQDLLGFLKSINCPAHRFAVAIRPVYLLEAEIKWVDSYVEL
jgi:DNA-binding PadR family transcriptional regulator